MSPDRSYTWAETTPISSVQDLGTAIMRRRRSFSLSKRKLGERTGVAPSAISRIELEGDERIPFGAILRSAEALELGLELRPRGSKFAPRPPTRLNELGLSPHTLSALSKAGLENVDQLGGASSMLARTEFSSGAELYEIVCALNRHGLSLPTSHAHRARTDREREIFRLRIVDGLTLDELAQLYSLHKERIRQILKSSFDLSGTPPAASRRRMRRATGRRKGLSDQLASPGSASRR